MADLTDKPDAAATPTAHSAPASNEAPTVKAPAAAAADDEESDWEDLDGMPWFIQLQHLPRLDNIHVLTYSCG